MDDERFIRANEAHLVEAGWRLGSLRCEEIVRDRIEDAFGAHGQIVAVTNILTAIIESVDSDTRNAIMSRLGWVPKK